MGIKTVMITGETSDCCCYCREAGVDDFMAEAKQKINCGVFAKNRERSFVGMIGDGTNDAPALAQADIGIAMNSGTQAAREAETWLTLKQPD